MRPQHKRKKTKKIYKKKVKKQTIPKALREQLWIKNCGKEFEHKCYVDWCENIINPFDYHVGHDKPESKGGTLDISNIIKFIITYKFNNYNIYIHIVSFFRKSIVLLRPTSNLVVGSQFKICLAN